jgi:hypothetical protein
MEEDFRTLAELLAERAGSRVSPDPEPVAEPGESEQLGLF